MTIRSLLSLSFAALPSLLLAHKGVPMDRILQEETEKPVEASPWFTGPLLAPSGHVIPGPHVNYEPYIYWYDASDVYDSKWNAHSVDTYNSLQTQGTFQVGLTSFMEFDFAPQFSYNHANHKHDWVLNDLPISFGFQLFSPDKENRFAPFIKLKLSANIPIGKYEKLNRRKAGTDLGGSGNWSPSAGVVLGRLIHLTGVHFLALRYYLAYQVPTPEKIKGINNYGGSLNTHGTVYPGCGLLNIFAFELSLAQRWTLACDFQYVHKNKTRFSGTPGEVSPRAPSSEQFSIAPALEYNWSNNIGIIGGPWFTVAGRNSAKFLQWVFAINIYV